MPPSVWCSLHHFIIEWQPVWTEIGWHTHIFISILCSRGQKAWLDECTRFGDALFHLQWRGEGPRLFLLARAQPWCNISGLGGPWASQTWLMSAFALWVNVLPYPSESICSLGCYCVILICSTFSTHADLNVCQEGSRPCRSDNMSDNSTNNISQPLQTKEWVVTKAAHWKGWRNGGFYFVFPGAVCFPTQTCSVDGVCRPWSPQLECQSVPVEQSSRRTQPRECKAQAQSQEIALESTPVWWLIIREGGGKYGALYFSIITKERCSISFFRRTNRAIVLLSTTRPDADNETREQRRRRVGKVLVPHSAARDWRWLGTCAMLASARYGQEVKARATAASHQSAWTCAHTEEEKSGTERSPRCASSSLWQVSPPHPPPPPPHHPTHPTPNYHTKNTKKQTTPPPSSLLTPHPPPPPPPPDLIWATSPIKNKSLCIIRRRFSLNMFSGN